jgi:hypothetical protein
MIHPDGHYNPDRADASQEIVINFRLRRDASKLIFRIARGGDSATLITLDGGTNFG